MGVLTTEEKTRLRNGIEKKSNSLGIPQRWIKAALDDSAQAIEDILDSTSFKTTISGAIDDASSPYGVTFTNAEKKYISAIVFDLKFSRDII